MGLYKDENGKVYEYDYRNLKPGMDNETYQWYKDNFKKIKVYIGKDNHIRGYVIMD